MMLFRIWQNALMNKSMMPQEIWQCVHNVYGEQLGLTSDDEDYIDPKNESSNEASAEKKVKCPTTSGTETDQSREREKKIITKYAAGSFSADSSTLRSTQSKLRMRKDLEVNDIPTDVSNTTDSEEENSVPFECTAECTSMHEGRQLVHTILPINVDSLLTMLFSKSKFFAEFHSIRKTTNMIYREWVDNNDGTKCRTINFTVAVTQAVGPKTSNVKPFSFAIRICFNSLCYPRCSLLDDRSASNAWLQCARSTVFYWHHFHECWNPICRQF